MITNHHPTVWTHHQPRIFVKDLQERLRKLQEKRGRLHNKNCHPSAKLEFQQTWRYWNLCCFMSRNNSKAVTLIRLWAWKSFEPSSLFKWGIVRQNGRKATIQARRFHQPKSKTPSQVYLASLLPPIQGYWRTISSTICSTVRVKVEVVGLAILRPKTQESNEQKQHKSRWEILFVVRGWRKRGSLPGKYSTFSSKRNYFSYNKMQWVSTWRRILIQHAEMSVAIWNH